MRACLLASPTLKRKEAKRASDSDSKDNSWTHAGKTRQRGGGGLASGLCLSVPLCLSL